MFGQAGSGSSIANSAERATESIADKSLENTAPSSQSEQFDGGTNGDWLPDAVCLSSTCLPVIDLESFRGLRGILGIWGIWDI